MSGKPFYFFRQFAEAESSLRVCGVWAVAYHDQGETVQMRLMSLKVWFLYAVLEESFGTFKVSKAVYDRVMGFRIATPQIVINCEL